MNGIFRISTLCLAAFLAAVMPVAAQNLIEPPFGLRWGDSPEKLISWASRHSLDLTINLPGDQPKLRVIKIEPRKGFLPESKASAVEARFFSGQLFEFTVHYTDPDASADTMRTRFDELRKQVANEHGPLLPNQQQQSVEDQFVTRKQSFHREPVKGLFLLLAFTEVEDQLRKSREARFSLVYRNDNLRKELVGETPPP